MVSQEPGSLFAALRAPIVISAGIPARCPTSRFRASGFGYRLPWASPHDIAA